MTGSALIALISAAAALVSAVVAVIAYRSSKTVRRQSEQDAENLNKRDLFLSLHEKLTAPEQLWGRRVIREQINTPEDAERLRQLDREDGHAAASAVAMLDILSLYVERGFVEKDLVLDEWGHALADLNGNAAIFVRDRTENGRAPWCHFQDFSAEAVKWSRDRRW
ncbi:hypothetical protein [Streptomyces sp. NPDC002324]